MHGSESTTRGKEKVRSFHNLEVGFSEDLALAKLIVLGNEQS
jgi:hypothetical protein